MKWMADILTVLGEHFSLLLILSAEVLAAVALAAAAIGRRRKKENPEEYGTVRGAESVFLHELGRRESEVCILLRREDMMPLFVSGDMESFLGLSLEAIQSDISRFRTVFQSAEEADNVWKAYKAWDGQGEFDRQYPLKNGAWVRMMVHRSENTVHDLLTFRDTTKIHGQVEAYEKRLHEAEDASQSKTTFLSRMSHEIRTPMNGIMGMLTLAEGKLQPEDPAMQYLTKADQLSEHLLSLINDILDMSRIEAGKVELEKAPFSLRELGGRLYDMFAKNLEARGIAYSVDFEAMTVDRVVGDELRISQVIVNFLSNAVKFTSEGEIRVTFRQMLVRDGWLDLMIRVHDTGIGMDPEFISRLFRPFEQESLDTTRQFGGTGLGMAITDQLVKLMGGQIVVESAKNVGSDFTVFLHLPEAADAVEDAAEEKAVPAGSRSGVLTAGQEQNSNVDDIFRGRRILLAEDNEVNAMIAEEILQEMGAEVETAVNGQKAVEAFSSHPENYYDCILMDVQMPVMDGRTAARTIRSLKRPDAATILIFALSADAFVEDERLSMESGMNGHYAKPIDFELLKREMEKFWKTKGQGEE